MYNGLINIYKEPGFTSFDVVAVLRGILKQKKIGHTGTLDPAAEGVLLVCLGNGTKLVDMLDNKDKIYECRMLLGTETDTEDTTGKTVAQGEVTCTKEEIEEAVQSFRGNIMQIPPMYSAIKKDGKKLYELAREGKEISREARPVRIYDIEIQSIDLPYVTFTVHCGKGTYVRSLCRDIGKKLGCGACMDHLKRVSVSHFTVDKSLKLSDVERISKEGRIEDFILPVEEVFKNLDSLYVKAESKKYIDNGNVLVPDNFENACINPEDGRTYKVYNAEKWFVAVYRYDSSKDAYIPEKMFQRTE